MASPRPLKLELSKSGAPTRKNENVASILTGAAVAAEAVKRWATIIPMIIFMQTCVIARKPTRTWSRTCVRRMSP